MVVYQSGVGTSTSLRVKSTPPECFDVVECVVEDQVLPATGSVSVSLVSVVGQYHNITYMFSSVEDRWIYKPGSVHV